MSTNPGEPIWGSLQRFRDGIASKARELRGVRNSNAQVSKFELYSKNQKARHYIAMQKPVEISVRDQAGEKYYIRQGKEKQKPQQ